MNVQHDRVVYFFGLVSDCYGEKSGFTNHRALFRETSPVSMAILPTSSLHRTRVSSSDKVRLATLMFQTGLGRSNYTHSGEV